MLTVENKQTHKQTRARIEDLLYEHVKFHYVPHSALYLQDVCQHKATKVTINVDIKSVHPLHFLLHTMRMPLSQVFISHISACRGHG